MTIPVGFGQATLTWTGAPVPRGAATVFGFQNTLDLSAASCAETIQLLTDAFLMPAMDSGITLENVRVKLGPDDTGAVADSGQGAGGGLVQLSAPPNVSWLITKSSNLGGKRGRGRLYLPGVGEVAVGEGGTIDNADVLAMQTAVGNWLDELTAADMPMVILHGPPTEWQLIDGQPRRVPIAGAIPVPSPVTALAVSSTVATQRRRVRP